MTNLDTKGSKRSVMMWATNFYKSFFKKKLSQMNGRLSKIRSVHTYGVRYLCRFMFLRVSVHWYFTHLHPLIWISKRFWCLKWFCQNFCHKKSTHFDHSYLKSMLYIILWNFKKINECEFRKWFKAMRLEKSFFIFFTIKIKVFPRFSDNQLVIYLSILEE